MQVAQAPPVSSTPDSDQLKLAIITLCDKLGGDWHKAVSDHIVAMTGAGNLNDYCISEDVTEEQKRSFLRDLFLIVNSRKAEKLMAAPVVGEATLTGEEEEVTFAPRSITPPVAAPVTSPPPVAPAILPMPPVKLPGNGNGGNGNGNGNGHSGSAGHEPEAIRKMREALQAIGGLTTDPDPVKIDEAIKSRFDAFTKRTIGDIDKVLADTVAELDKAIEAKVAARVAAMPPRSDHVITINGKQTIITGFKHRQFNQVLRWLTARVPVWLWSEAGAGKTEMFFQLSKALAVEPWVLSMDPTITVGKLLGFTSQAGANIRGLLADGYQKGGLVGLDEIDVAEAAIASMNTMLSNSEYLFPWGERIQRHSDCYFIAGANTKGTGAVTGYTARVRLDASTLDRFAIIKLDYDEGMEMKIACHSGAEMPEWQGVEPAGDQRCFEYVRWVQRVRAGAKGDALISPRASIHGVRALKAGIPMTEVADALVFKLMDDGDRERALRANPLPL